MAEGALEAVLYSLPKHHIGESEAESTDGSGSQKYFTIRLYRSTVVIVAPYAARGSVLSGIRRYGLDGGECGGELSLAEIAGWVAGRMVFEGVEEFRNGRVGELGKSSRVSE